MKDRPPEANMPLWAWALLLLGIVAVLTALVVQWGSA
jgi:hypothetical protein